MNILWIEDFGKGQKDEKRFANLLFGELLNRPFNRWKQQSQSRKHLLSEAPEDMDEFTAKASGGRHRISLHRHYPDFCRYKDKGIYSEDFDCFVIDLDLTRGINDHSTIPPGFAEIPDEFHSKAGHFIYQELITQHGIDRDNIAFMSANVDRDNFGTFDDDRWPIHPIHKFDKGSGPDLFKKWLKERSDDRYIQLRRAIIEGVEFVRNKVMEDSDNLQYNQIINSGSSDETLSTDSFLDHLETLSMLLPATVRGDRSHSYRLLMSAMLSHWEAYNYKTDLREWRKWADHLKYFRNWSSHSKTLDECGALNEIHIAALFLINMRCMIRMDSHSIEPYETLLLGLVGQDSSPPNEEDSYSDLRGQSADQLDLLLGEARSRLPSDEKLKRANARWENEKGHHGINIGSPINELYNVAGKYSPEERIDFREQMLWAICLIEHQLNHKKSPEVFNHLRRRLLAHLLSSETTDED